MFPFGKINMRLHKQNPHGVKCQPIKLDKRWQQKIPLQYSLLPFVTSNDKYIRVKLPGVLPREVWDSPREFQRGRLLSWLILHSTHSSLSFRNYKMHQKSKKKNHKTLKKLQTIQSHLFHSIPSEDQIESTVKRVSHLPWAEQDRRQHQNAARASPHPLAAAKHEQININKTSNPPKQALISSYHDQNKQRKNRN